MKKTLLPIIIVMLAFSSLHAQTTHTIMDDGFAFSPDTLSINTGDSVIFSGSDFHPVLQVSEDTWINNGVTPLEGGFNFPGGNGKLKLTEADTIYYVCTAHVASNGMKGIIFVSLPTVLPDIKGHSSFSIFPVPLTGSVLHIGFKVKSQQQIRLSVYDLAGNLRISSTGSISNGQYDVNCNDLPKGMYLIKLSSEAGVEYAKFVRQ